MLAFKPAWVCDQVCHLALFNSETNETYEYELTGTADEPLAEDHVVIQCKAREKTDHEFQVKNWGKTESQFEVESDIVHISGPSHVRAVFIIIVNATRGDWKHRSMDNTLCPACSSRDTEGQLTAKANGKSGVSDCTIF